MRRLTGRIRHIPRLTGTTVNPARVKVGSTKELPGSDGIDGRIVAVQDSLPTADNLIGATAAEEVVPLLPHKCRATDKWRARKQRQHVNTLDILNVGAEVGRVIDLVLKQDAGYAVGDEVGGLDSIVVGVEVVVLQGPRENGQLQVSSEQGVSKGIHNGNVAMGTYLATMLESPTVCPHILMAYACMTSSELLSWSFPSRDSNRP